ncbi:ribonuclease R [candidate division KSB1 bacterium]|nr:MAG: ribonuclease R [candidate division KSB1 bacterium]
MKQREKTSTRQKNLEKQIVSFLERNPNRRFKSKTIARSLGIPQARYQQFRNLLRTLATNGIITRDGRNAYRLRGTTTTVIGRLRVKSQGYGFVELEEGGDEIFVSQRNMHTAFDGDIVRVELFARPSKGRLQEGRIVEVVKRQREYIVGTFCEGKYFAYVVPDGLKILWDIIIPNQYRGRAKQGQKVVVKIAKWEDVKLNPEGRVVEVLGYPEEVGVDVLSVAKSFGLPTKFPLRVLQEAEPLCAGIPAAEIIRRLDLRQQLCFTIDPVDAKDFDDAISLQVLENGHYLLGVHIADVSYYVPEGSKTDHEALMRGTSVYLVDRVIPMLPEKLSNQICSLWPHSDRLTFSVLIELDASGQVVNYQIRESVIRSKRRFTYEEVQQILDEGDGEYFETLNAMRRLSKILYRNRLRQGSLDFETPEVKVLLNEKGQPLGISKQVRLESHQLIEEFMLLANRVVSKHIAVHLAQNGRRRRSSLPFIYRIHEKPDQKKIKEFVRLIEALGYSLEVKRGVRAQHLQRLLETVRGQDEELIINTVMLRSLMKARYSPENVGHFGLAFDYYTHFTSPIRRYPDLVVHRLLKEYLQYTGVNGGMPPERREYWEELLPEICQIANEREIAAMEAERKSVKIKQAEYMQTKLGESYEGVISGVVPFGIFVELTENLVEGLVHVKDLENDYFIHDEKHYALVGQRSGKVYRLGDKVRVQVVRAVPKEGIVDFVLAK